jgi:hypothetical protein
MSNVFNKPDIKAPRYKKVSDSVDVSKLARKVAKAYPQYKDQITDPNYRKIIKAFIIYVKNKILTTRYGVELPEGLGYMMLLAYKSKKRLLNKKQSEIYGVKIYETNLHSDGYYAKMLYTNDKMKYKLSNRDMWGFTAIETFRESVSKAFKEDWKRYIQANVYQHICRNIDSNIKYKSELGELEATYNEFDI